MYNGFIIACYIKLTYIVVIIYLMVKQGFLTQCLSFSFSNTMVFVLFSVLTMVLTPYSVVYTHTGLIIISQG